MSMVANGASREELVVAGAGLHDHEPVVTALTAERRHIGSTDVPEGLQDALLTLVVHDVVDLDGPVWLMR